MSLHDVSPRGLSESKARVSVCPWLGGFLAQPPAARPMGLTRGEGKKMGEKGLDFGTYEVTCSAGERRVSEVQQFVFRRVSSINDSRCFPGSGLQHEPRWPGKCWGFMGLAKS